MDYTEFVIDYVKTHSWMSNEELLDAIPVAWKRYNLRPIGDQINNDHWDRVMVMETERAIARLFPDRF